MKRLNPNTAKENDRKWWKAGHILFDGVSLVMPTEQIQVLTTQANVCFSTAALWTQIASTLLRQRYAL